MERLRYLILAVVAFVATVQCHAGWRVVIDPKTITVVGANTAAQKLIEDAHNKRLDSIMHKKQQLEKYTISMATIKELYKTSMENISGFGTESMYYKEISACAIDILADVPTLVKTVSKAKFHRQLLCYGELTGITMETRQLVKDFINIVNNAKVKNPLSNKKPSDKENDGYNLLDRYERLTLANRIYTRLMEIRYKVDGMMAMAQYATLNDLCFAIDPTSWASAVAMNNHVDMFIRNWKGLNVWKGHLDEVL